TSQRLGIDRPLELKRYEIEGVVRIDAGDIDAGIRAHEKALELVELVYGKDSPTVFADEQLIGTTYQKIGAFEKAAPHLERSLKLREASIGSDTLEVAILQSGLGLGYTYLHQFAKAKPALERSLAIRRELFGDPNPLMVVPLDDLA